MPRIFRVRWVALAFVLVGCQAIADLTVPTYESSTETGAGNSSPTGSTGAAGGPNEGGGGGLVTGNGGACTTPNPAIAPPCPEHLQLWLSADRTKSIDVESGGQVTTWRDLTSSRWVATPTDAGTATLVKNVIGHPGVHINGAGMVLGGGRDFASAGVSVAATIKWEKFSPGEVDFGASDVLCLGSGFHDQMLRFGVGNGMNGARANAVVTDRDGAFTIADTSPGPDTTSWGVYTFAYGCDARCKAGGPATDWYLAYDDQHDAGDQVEGSGPPVTLLPDSFGWDGGWDKSTLGSKCDQANDLMDAEVGELLVYDKYLDLSEEMPAVYAYLSMRW